MPTTPQESLVSATEAIAQSSQQGALIIYFPECFVPGYRWPGTVTPPPDPGFLAQAWAEVAEAAKAADITVILGTERLSDRKLCIARQLYLWRSLTKKSDTHDWL